LIDKQTDGQTDRHDEDNSPFWSSANASKSDWTVFHTTAKRNTQEGRSCYVNKCKKEAVMRMATFCFKYVKYVGWRRVEEKTKEK